MPDRPPRHVAWIELSELWLDTEHADGYLDGIARTLGELPFSLGEIDEIHWREVAPVLRGNLWPPNVAGEWAGFDPDWLVERCREQAARRHRWRSKLWASYLRREGNAQYDAVRSRLEADLEGGPA